MMYCQKARIVEPESWDSIHPDSHAWVRQHRGAELWVEATPPQGTHPALHGGMVSNSVRTPYLWHGRIRYRMSLDVLELLPESADVPDQPLPDWIDALHT